MTTCPRCGREADDEFVCPDCGAFLAGGRDDAPVVEVSVGRVALLALLVCLLAAVGAVVLLKQHGGGQPSALPGAVTSNPVALSTAPLGQAPGPGRNPSGSSAPRSTASGSSGTSTAASSSSASGSASASKSAHRSTSAAPSSSSRSTPTPTTPHSSPSSPRPSSSHPSTTQPPSTPPPPAPSVRLAKSGSAVCGPHCFALVVTLDNFAAGQHDVSCFSGHSGQFGGYTTSSVTSSNCVYDHPHDTVWVVVDGHRSNTVSW